MVGWSSICRNGVTKTPFLQILSINSKRLRPNLLVNYVPKSSSHSLKSDPGAKAGIFVRYSFYQYTKFKDLMILYFLLGMIPITLLAAYCHIFIGPAKLVLTPEDYQPKHWEYFEHPISRFLARYVLQSEQEIHERNMYHYFITREKDMLKQLQHKIKTMMSENLDSQAWYFETYPAKYQRFEKEIHQEAFWNREGKMANFVK